MLVDAANGCRGGSLLLEKLRFEGEEITPEKFTRLIQEIMEKDKDNLMDNLEWEFTD